MSGSGQKARLPYLTPFRVALPWASKVRHAGRRGKPRLSAPLQVQIPRGRGMVGGGLRMAAGASPGRLESLS